MTHLDLFSGIGGFTIAAQAAGFTTIGFSEIEPYACKILKQHWPDVPNYGDIRNVPEIRADLITGGPPCQPASCAGKRRGKEDDRWLWPQTLACVERIKPTLCLFENPTGILSLNGGVEFEGVLSGLEAIGYAVQPIIVPAVGVDAEHERDRAWIIAHINGERKLQPQGSFKDQRGWIGNGLEAVANPDSARHEGRRATRENFQDEGNIKARNGFGRHASSEVSREHWNHKPVLGGRLHGIPNRSHRIRGLGNAIVPQVAEVILREMARLLHDT